MTDHGQLPALSPQEMGERPGSGTVPLGECGRPGNCASAPAVPPPSAAVVRAERPGQPNMRSAVPDGRQNPGASPESRAEAWIAAYQQARREAGETGSILFRAELSWEEQGEHRDETLRVAARDFAEALMAIAGEERLVSRGAFLAESDAAAAQDAILRGEPVVLVCTEQCIVLLHDVQPVGAAPEV